MAKSPLRPVHIFDSLRGKLPEPHQTAMTLSHPAIRVFFD